MLILHIIFLFCVILRWIDEVLDSCEFDVTIKRHEHLPKMQNIQRIETLEISYFL